MNPGTIWILGQVIAVIVVGRNLRFWRAAWGRTRTTTAFDQYRSDAVRLGFSLLAFAIGCLSFWLTVDRYGWDEALVFSLYPEPSGPIPFVWQRTIILWGLIVYGQGFTVVSVLSRRLWDRVGEFPEASPDQITAIAEKTAAELKVITEEDAAQIKQEFDSAVDMLKTLGEETKEEAQRSYQEANHVNLKIESLNEQIEALNKRLLSVIAGDIHTIERIDETTLDTQKTTAATDELLRESLSLQKADAEEEQA